MKNCTGLLSCSNEIKHEYCATVVRIGELVPVETSDNLVKTLINGNSIVMSRGSIQEGEIAFYVSNECEINADFLSVNNQFELSEYERNANRDEVGAILKGTEDLKNKIEVLKKKIKNINKVIDKYNERCGVVKKIEEFEGFLAENKDNYEKLSNTPVGELSEDETQFIKIYEAKTAKLKKTNERLGKYDRVKDVDLNQLNGEIKAIKDKITEFTNEREEMKKPAKEKVGYFNKWGRVKLIRLCGCPSYGYVFGVDSMRLFCPEIDSVNLEELVDCDFDTVKVNGESVCFCKAYVPRIVENQGRGSRGKKKVKKEPERMIPNEFCFHYDTTQFQRCVRDFNKDDIVDISVKLHGTSIIIGNVKIKFPIEFNTPFGKLNKMLQTAYYKYVPKRWQKYNIGYYNVYSSRKVIKNKELNPDVTDGFYDVDLWSVYNDLLKEYIPKGITIYGEVVGYLPNSGKSIQHFRNGMIYDYGCPEGESKLMIYRITEDDPKADPKKVDKKIEYTITEVDQWTRELVRKHPELNKNIMFLPILYHGRFGDLYPELEESTRWHDDVLEKLKTEERFGMEQMEPLCVFHECPREGIVIRKELDGRDPLAKEAYKLKTVKFDECYRQMMDDNVIGDLELAEGM